jgi:uncharacterized membrane protein YdfJ with MMPL/SSD domain
LWLILGGLGGSVAQRFQDVQRNEESSFLPGSSESVRELALAKRPRPESASPRSVVRRDGGLNRRSSWRCCACRWPRFGSEGTDETHGTWRRVGERVAATPRGVWITTVLLLGLGCLGLTSFSTGLTNTQDVRGRVQSVEGQRLIAKAFPAGANAPTDVVVRDVRAVPRVQRALRSVPGVAAVGSSELGGPGARFGLTLNANPDSTTAENLVPRLRAAVHAASPTALVGGPTAQQKTSTPRPRTTTG